MESKTQQFPSDDQTHKHLDILRSDRHDLAARLDGPRWLGPGLGVVVAAFVASPVVPDESWRNTVFLLALAASIALLASYRRATGIKLSRVGPRASLIYAVAAGLTLLLLSVSYGLAAGGLSWWVSASAVAAFLLVTWLVRLFISAARDHLHHGI